LIKSGAKDSIAESEAAQLRKKISELEFENKNLKS
jgi:hypothetical protein